MNTYMILIYIISITIATILYLILYYMLPLGASVNFTDPEGRTPLIVAAAVGNAHAVRTLIQHGADITHKDCTGKCAFQHTEVLIKYQKACCKKMRIPFILKNNVQMCMQLLR